MIDKALGLMELEFCVLLQDTRDDFMMTDEEFRNAMLIILFSLFHTFYRVYEVTICLY